MLFLKSIIYLGITPVKNSAGPINKYPITMKTFPAIIA